MTRAIVTSPKWRYTVSPDVTLPDGNRCCSLVEARLIDELTGFPVATPVAVAPAGQAFARASARAAVQPRVADGGIIGLAGIPIRVMPAVTVTSYELGMSITANGYVPVTRAGTLALPADYPTTFEPLPLGDVMLHRRGVAIHGRVLKRLMNGNLDPVNGAHVRLLNVWRALPTLTVPGVAQPPNTLALGVGLYASRTPATARIRSLILSPNPLEAKVLSRPAAAGDRVIHVSDRIGLTLNEIVGIDRPGLARTEHMVIATVDNSVPLAAAGTITLVHPLRLDHPEGAEVVRVTRQGPFGPLVPFALDGLAGDDVLVLSSMGGLGAPTAVEISGGGAIREYHEVVPAEDTTDQYGFYRLPPIAREAQVQIEATSGLLSLSKTVSLEYPAREQRLDFVFS